MSTSLPEFLNKFDVSSPQAQREPWVLNAQWKGFLANHSHVVNNLESEINEHGGIRRSFLMALADGDVEDFFLSVMAWGFAKNNVHYPAQVSLMTPPFNTANLQAIVDVVRNKGSEAGWKAMKQTHKVYGLGYGFGTKLLYFAGYGNVPNGPQPLILDSRVSSALANRVNGFSWSDNYEYATARNYMRYLELAQEWSADPTWNGSPETVEYALFSVG